MLNVVAEVVSFLNNLVSLVAFCQRRATPSSNANPIPRGARTAGEKRWLRVVKGVLLELELHEARDRKFRRDEAVLWLRAAAAQRMRVGAAMAQA